MGGRRGRCPLINYAFLFVVCRCSLLMKEVGRRLFPGFVRGRRDMDLIRRDYALPPAIRVRVRWILILI